MEPTQELVAIEAIKKRKRLYAHHLDNKELEPLVACFTADAECRFGATYGKWSGTEAIRDGYRVEFDKVEGVELPFMHAITTPVVDLIDESTARGSWFLLEMGTESTDISNALRLTGVYDDVYSNVGGSWLIAKTSLSFTWPMRDVQRGRIDG